MPFDVGELAVTGGAIPVVEGIMAGGTAAIFAHYSVSETGSLIYLPDIEEEERTLVWVDRGGREEAIAAEPHLYSSVRISPDGSRVALDVRDLTDIWIWDLDRETLTRLTFDPALDSRPAWTPDGRRVAFGSSRGGIPNLYWKAADGSGVVEPLNESQKGQFPLAFTPDGRRLVFFESEGTSGVSVDLGTLSLDGSVEPLLAT